MSLPDTAAPDFSDPLGLLAACHRRMLGFCTLLERMQPWLQSHGIDEEVRESTQRILRYFSTAGPLHHEDEEQDLFPLLYHENALRPVIDRLHSEHDNLEQCWLDLSQQLDGLLQGRYDQQLLHSAVAPFCAAYRRHIHDEESQLLTEARTRLTETQLRALGESMAARRRPPSESAG